MEHQRDKILDRKCFPYHEVCFVVIRPLQPIEHKSVSVEYNVMCGWFQDIIWYSTSGQSKAMVLQLILQYLCEAHSDQFLLT